ncbi:hypothetical protein A2U01_0059248, partial [Trifolium medium]|nr:hypothetical protein [Trifolium medium]
NAQTGQSAGGTAGSRRESGPVLCNPGQQPSVGDSSVVIPNPSCSAAHKESQSSPTHNLNSGAAGGCEMDPDVAVLLAVVVAVVLLPVLPVTLSLPSEKMYDQEVA